MRNTISILRRIALAEAVSFLVLLGLAMPLKYIWGMPAAVKVAGWVHGILFILFCAALVQTIIVAKWPLSRSAMLFVAALVPFGPFAIDHRMIQYEEEFRNRSGDASERP